MTSPGEPVATIPVRVVPRASKEGVAGYHDGVLRVRLHAPPVEGKANESLARFLAGALGVPKGNVTLVAGQKGRSKIVRIAGMTLEEALAVLIPPGGPTGGDPRSPRTGSR